MARGIVKLAVLYADVSGSTRLYEQYGDSVARADIARCLEILSDAAAGLNGRVIRMIGDEVMCAFADPAKAALAAAEMQAALRAASEQGRFQMGRLRIKAGWHYGAALWRDGDLVGEAPTTAQQIMKKAKADEILTTGRALAALPPGFLPDTYLIERVQAEAWNGDLEIYVQPWEQTGEETQVMPAKLGRAPRVAIVLEYRGQQYRIDDSNPRCRIGRAKDSDLQVGGAFTSRQHAEIIYRNGRICLHDESVNGTVIVDEQGTVKRLRREEDVLSGSGTIGFGAPPDEDPNGTVQYRIDWDGA